MEILIEPILRVAKACSYALGLLSLYHVSSTGSRSLQAMRSFSLCLFPYRLLRLCCWMSPDTFSGIPEALTRRELIAAMSSRIREVELPRALTLHVVTRNRDIPSHIINELERLYKLEESFPDCVICYEKTERGTLSVTGCGHIMCKACRIKVKKCPICREALVYLPR